MSRPSSNYPAELRGRTVRMFAEVRPDHASDWKAAESIAEDAAEIRKLRAEDRELKRANEILKAASIFFAAALDRPPT